MKKIPAAHNNILALISAPLLTWYHSQARSLPWRDEPTPYRVWISEIMLQQTRVAAALPYFERFMAALPDVKSLAEADEQVLLKLWEGLGYYNRARNLQKAARQIMEQYQGRIPADFTALLSLPGIGRYTAGAVSSIAFAQRHPAVDGNVLRVVMRLTACSDDILKESTKRRVETLLAAVMPEGAEAGAFNQALMELGAQICLPKTAAHCPRCPLNRLCLAFAEDCAADYPHKTAPKKRRIEKLTILLLEQEGKIAIRQREAAGLLASLWELPHVPGHPAKSEIKTILQQAGFSPAELLRLPPARHVFSHIEWQMHGWRIQLRKGAIAEATACYSAGEIALPSDLRWITRQELENYSIPSAFQYYFSAI